MQNSNYTPKEPQKRLYRSRNDRMIAGVCGGIAEYSNIDSVLVRILFVVMGLMGGLGLVLYIVGIIIIPENPWQKAAIKDKKDHAIFWGALLIILGVVLLLSQMSLFPPIHLWALPWHLLWAILLIALGMYLLLAPGSKKDTVEAPQDEINSEGEKQDSTTIPPEPKTLYRSRKNRMIAGVCGGLAEYFNMDPTIVRLLYVILTLFSNGLGILAYIILILAVPEEKENEV
ncbi:PspC domain-containing protein [Calditrichota bacterium GD2]